MLYASLSVVVGMSGVSFRFKSTRRLVLIFSMLSTIPLLANILLYWKSLGLVLLYTRKPFHGVVFTTLGMKKAIVKIRGSSGT